MGKPIRNVVFLLADQHRADCLGCYGNPIVRTPHLDALCEHGVRFTRALSPSPICTPARACIQTGFYAHDHGCVFNPEFAASNGGRTNINPDVAFFANRLRGVGWNLAHIGKWHIGDMNEAMNPTKPGDVGYDDDPYYSGYGYPMSPWGNHPHYVAYLKKFGVDRYSLMEPVMSADGKRTYAAITPGPREASVPYYLASQTAARIRDYGGREAPFFVSCNFWGPHQPVFLPESVYRAYEGVDIPVWPNVDADLSRKPDICRRWGHLWGLDTMEHAALSRLIGYHYAYITHIDECVGMIMEALRDTGRLDETLLVYSSDHGDSLGSFRMFDKGFGLYECLVNVPMMLSNPSFESSVSDASVGLLDLPATFFDVAGLSTTGRMPGASLLPLARGDVNEIHGETQIVMHYGHSQPAQQVMARNRRHKLILNLHAAHEFYDLEHDPHERDNQYDRAFHDETERLRQAALDWIGTQVPAFTPWFSSR